MNQNDVFEYRNGNRSFYFIEIYFRQKLNPQQRLKRGNGRSVDAFLCLQALYHIKSMRSILAFILSCFQEQAVLFHILS